MQEPSPHIAKDDLKVVEDIEKEQVDLRALKVLLQQNKFVCLKILLIGLSTLKQSHIFVC
jgi:hypothetical protein